MAQDSSIAALVSSAIADTRALIQQQIDLAKAEMRQSAKEAAASSGLFIGAGVLAFLGFVFVLVAAAYGIVAAGLPVWAGFLIVAVVLILVALILALVGRARSKRIGPPQRAIAAANETAQALQRAVPGSGAGAGIAAGGAGPAAGTPAPATGVGAGPVPTSTAATSPTTPTPSDGSSPS